MSNLNTSEYQLIHSKTVDGQLYEVYRPLGNPMILFSEVDGSPLVSLHFSAQDTETQTGEFKGKALITNRPDKSTEDLQMFQGLMDRDGQEFQLTITNLSHNGYINFNILHTDEEVTVVNPGGLNQINELRPLESYKVKSDQTTGNTSLILNSITEKDATTGKEKKVTLKEDEESKTGTKGTYFYLSVVPQLGNAQLQAKFEKTYWATASLIALRRTAPVPVAVPVAGMHHHYGRVHRRNAIRPLAVGNFDIMYDRMPEVAAAPMDMMMNVNNVEEDYMVNDMSVGAGALMCDGFDNEELDSDSDDFDDLTVKTNGVVRERHYETTNIKHKKSKKFVAKSAGFTTSQVLNTKAAKLGQGRKIVVNSMETEVEYDYDKSSFRCVIGLSVADNINFAAVGTSPTMETMVADAESLIKEVIDGKYVDWLQTAKLFKSNECVICMDDEEALDCVYYTCGHQCASMECSKIVEKCPLCRNYIAVKLDLASLSTHKEAETPKLLRA